MTCGRLYLALALNEGDCRYYVCCPVCIYIYVFVSLGCTVQVYETVSGKMKLPVAALPFGTRLF